jgi:tetratricopeptide (TPR) repeat protein
MTARSLVDLAEEVLAMANAAAAESDYDRAATMFHNVNLLLPLVGRSFLQSGRCHWEMRRWEQARNDFGVALQLNPTDDNVAWAVGLLALQMGDFQNGWKMYERRLGTVLIQTARFKTDRPRWEAGNGLTRPVIWAEQGVGDQILYGSLIEAVAKQCEHVTVLLDARLVGLFRRGCKAENVTFLPQATRIKAEDHDSHIPMGSLGSHFIHELADISAHRSESYLKAHPARVAHWRKQLNVEGERLIGLSWASTAAVIGEEKTVGLKNLRPLFDLPRTKFVNLQYGRAKKDAEGFHPNLVTTHIDTFLDLENLAALMEACDVVVSPSNVNAHLAGALGKDVLLLDANKLWYWNSRVGQQSLWYPSLQVFQRENMNAAWDVQVQQVKEMLCV